MLGRSAFFIGLTFLSGCTMLSAEQAPKRDTNTLTAIEMMETNVHFRLNRMSQQINEQNENIAKLEKELSSMSEDLNKVASVPPPKPEVIVEKKIVPVPQNSIDIDPKTAHGKVILGEEEWVWLDSVQSFFKARVDTGATTSSINALDVQIFERDGKQWARFNLSHSGEENQPADQIVEAPVVRWVKIRQSSADDSERRPVVEMWLKLGKLHEKAQFTLADRTQMTYPVLLGREFFKDVALVDVGKQFVQGR
ncbi:ATP-dependent zinc protease [Photobacterium sp. 1_MG-2023]|nr:ATP-dependent zinc protease [Photobacterium sp. 1_MG-2023]MDO6705686.1 ATP-dependent zinc protease [Photobacterium sp. 1_MG-2023]